MLNDLVFVLKHIKTVIEEYGLLDVYTNFANTLQQISQASTEELQEQLKNYRSKIKEAHDSLEPKGWSHSQLQIFDRFGAKNILGSAGYTNFQKALSDNAANTPGAVEEINQQQKQITQLITNATNILSSLGGLVEDTEVEKGQKIVQIVFDEEVAINNITELSKQSQSWREIIRAYSILAQEAPENTIIISVNKSNPFAIWLSTAPLISKAFYHTVKPFIDLWHEVLELKIHALALEEKKIKVTKDKVDLLKSIEEYEVGKIKEIIESVADSYHKPEMNEADINNAKVALLKSGEDLYKFITGGGKVDTAKDENSSDSDGNFQLETTYQEVHKLRDNVQKLLTNPAKDKVINPEKVKKSTAKKRRRSRTKIK